MSHSLIKYFQSELQAEIPATRKCLERIPDSTFEYKPHEKSMKMGYLSLLVAEIPKWITAIIEEGVVDFATFHHPQQGEITLIEYFEQNIKGCEKALASLKDADLDKTFKLQNNGHVLMQQTLEEAIGSTFNHWVHHRGELVVYMRLNDILLPSIYGPSADDKGDFSETPGS